MMRLYFGLFLLVDAAAVLFDPLRQSRPVDGPRGSRTRGLSNSPLGCWLPPLAAVLFDPRTGKIKALKRMLESFYDPYGNRTHVTAVKGPCLNRLTNGPYKYRASLKPPTSIIHYCGRPSPLS